MRKETNENLGDMAHAVEQDHEVQLARSELYKMAKYAIKLHNMLKEADPNQGLEGWVQADISKSAESISKVFHSLEYEMKVGAAEDPDPDNMGSMKDEKNPLPFESKNPYKKSLSKRLSEKKRRFREAHGNSKVYDKCWTGYKKVPGKKRGEKGSCKKA